MKKLVLLITSLAVLCSSYSYGQFQLRDILGGITVSGGDEIFTDIFESITEEDVSTHLSRRLNAAKETDPYMYRVIERVIQDLRETGIYTDTLVISLNDTHSRADICDSPLSEESMLFMDNLKLIPGLEDVYDPCGNQVREALIVVLEFITNADDLVSEDIDYYDRTLDFIDDYFLGASLDNFYVYTDPVTHRERSRMGYVSPLIGMAFEVYREAVDGIINRTDEDIDLENVYRRQGLRNLLDVSAEDDVMLNVYQYTLSDDIVDAYFLPNDEMDNRTQTIYELYKQYIANPQTPSALVAEIPDVIVEEPLLTILEEYELVYGYFTQVETCYNARVGYLAVYLNIGEYERSEISLDREFDLSGYSESEILESETRAVESNSYTNNEIMFGAYSEENADICRTAYRFVVDKDMRQQWQAIDGSLTIEDFL